MCYLKITMPQVNVSECQEEITPIQGVIREYSLVF